LEGFSLTFAFSLQMALATIGDVFSGVISSELGREFEDCTSRRHNSSPLITLKSLLDKLLTPAGRLSEIDLPRGELIDECSKAFPSSLIEIALPGGELTRSS
jgi:hypothetical protein